MHGPDCSAHAARGSRVFRGKPRVSVHLAVGSSITQSARERAAREEARATRVERRRGRHELVPYAEGGDLGEIRRLGLRSFAIGALLFVPGLLLFIVAQNWLLQTFGTPGPNGTTVAIPRSVAIVIGGPMTAGYALVMIGLSRMLFGAAADSKSVAMGLVRLTFGVFATISFVVVGFVVVAIISRA